MKEATGELNMTVIVVIIIAALAGIGTLIIVTAVSTGVRSSSCRSILNDEGEIGENLNGIHITNLDGAEINGVCIRRYNVDVASSTSAYYKVITYVHFKLPIIGELFSIPVNGETKLIVNDNYEP